jgi:hypothetical protein
MGGIFTTLRERTSASNTSPAVAHELAITTADEKSLAIFSRVSVLVMTVEEPMRV